LSRLGRYCIKNPRGGDSDAGHRPSPTHFEFGKTLVCPKNLVCPKRWICKLPKTVIWLEHYSRSRVTLSKVRTGTALSRSRGRENLAALDMCKFQTQLHAGIPRVECLEHGVLQEAVPWAQVRSRLPSLWNGLLSTSSHPGRT